MSGTIAALTPQPERWGAFRAGNTDTRTRDATDDLTSVNDTVATVTASVARRDGQATTTQDLAWAGTASVDATRRIITVGLTCGLAPAGLTQVKPVDYVVTVTAQTTGGRVLNWDAFQLVVALIG